MPLGIVGDLKAGVIFAHLAEIQKAMDAGSVITMDNGVLALARAASKNENTIKPSFPIYSHILKNLPPKGSSPASEKTLPADYETASFA